MADKEHLDLVRQGVGTWNEWREKHPEVTPDLGGGNLVKADLRGADLLRVNLERANLTRAVLNDASLQGANLRGARLLEAELLGANLSEADLSQADLIGSKLMGANLMNANLHLAQVAVTNLKEANLRNADLSKADLREAVLLATDLRGANLHKSLLLGAHLEGANLTEARGLVPGQLEGAHTDQNTQLPGENVEQHNQQELVSGVYQFLLDLKKTTSGRDAVEERFVFELQGALKRLEELGHDVSGLDIPEEALSQGIASFDYTAGGAFEADPSRRVDGSLFHEKLDDVLGLFETDNNNADAVTFRK